MHLAQHLLPALHLILQVNTGSLVVVAVVSVVQLVYHAVVAVTLQVLLKHTLVVVLLVLPQLIQ